jgi:hypothetical protein
VTIFRQWNKSREGLSAICGEDEGEDLVVQPQRCLGNNFSEGLASNRHHLRRGIGEKLEERVADLKMDLSHFDEWDLTNKLLVRLDSSPIVPQVGNGSHGLDRL